MSTLHVQGVRHHSPACARLVRRTVETLRPRTILIEGPADMNERLGELSLPHALPVAIFSYHQEETRTHSSWTPFCDYSPEWVALRAGLEHGAAVRFIDLPAWATAFHEVENRYADRSRLCYVERLCEKLGADGLDALWDHLFEQPVAEAELGARLRAYFEALRIAEGDEGESHSERDRQRERFMAQHIAHAMATSEGDVLLVCGGYHAPFLEEAWRSLPPEPPELPVPGQGTRHGSYLVPYSFHRLDRFTGYQSGMPSPGFYQSVWELGAERASERVMEAAIRRLRDRKQQISAADLIAVETTARGLMRLRGHATMTRTDLLDAVATALLKDAQEHPLPWTERGPVRAGTDPMLVEVLIALTGERVGRLAEGTPRPPLVFSAMAELDRLGLTPARSPRQVTLDLTEPSDLERSRTLHRLRLLSIPGFQREQGAARIDNDVLRETWSIAKHIDLDASLIEASARGPDLEGAATAMLEELFSEVQADMAELARLVGEALLAGLLELAARALGSIQAAIGQEARLDRLGSALASLLGLYRHDPLTGSAGSATLGAVLSAMVRRGLWLLEGTEGAGAPAQWEELVAIAAIRDTVKHAASSLGIDPVGVCEVMRRKLADREAPPAHRGAALGYLWSMGGFDSDDAAREQALAALRASSLTHIVGEFLAGLFALGREQVAGERELVRALDEIIRDLSFDDLLRAIPSLRMAFMFFPPRERDALAREVLAIHGRPGASVSALRTLEAAPATVLSGVQLEQRVDAIFARFALEAVP